MKDWLIERALLDEVPEAHRAQVERSRGDDAVQRRLAELRASNEQIVAEIPPAEVAAEVERRLRIARIEREHRRVRIVRRFAWIGPAVAAAAALLVLLLRGTGPVDEDGVRVKGDPRLEFHRQVGDDAEPLRAGAPVAAGDRIQVSYIAAGRRFGVILSIDGRGAVTLHYPESPGNAGELTQGGAIALPFAYELDDAPGYERFFFVTADRPFDAELARLAAKRLTADPRAARTAPLVLPPDFAQQSYSFRKGPPR